ncbi:MAG: hypothetical protein FJ184_01280 [Gammaproteobacteria bacterium]|nr:hypothetical protein [Gammaproteobacteria bacterium]
MKSVRSPRAVFFGGALFRYLNLLVAWVSGLVVVPLSVKFVPADELAAWYAGGFLISVVQTLDLALPVVVQRQVAESYARTEREYKNFAVCGVVLAAFMAVLSLCMGLLTLKLFQCIPEFGHVIPVTIHSTMIVGICAAALNVYSNCITSINIGLQSRVFAQIITAFSVIIQTVVTFYCLNVGVGLESIVLGLASSSIVNALLGTCYLYSRLSSIPTEIQLGRTEIRLLVAAGWSVWMSRLLSALVNSIDIFIIKAFVGSKETIAYFVSKKLIDIFRELNVQGSVALMPVVARLSAAYSENQSNSHMRASLLLLGKTQLVILAFSMVGTYAFNNAFVTIWVSKDSWVGDFVFSFMLVGALFQVIGNILYNIGIASPGFQRFARLMILQNITYLGSVCMFGVALGTLGVTLALILSWLLVSALFARIFFQLIKEFISSSVVFVAGIFVICLITATIFNGVPATGLMDIAIEGGYFILWAALCSTLILVAVRKKVF